MLRKVFTALAWGVGTFVVCVPFVFFWIATFNFFDSSYYEMVIQAREFAPNSLLMDMIVWWRSATFTAVGFWAFGWALYGLYLGATTEAAHKAINVKVNP
jgi:hypothetical protein